MLLLILFSSQVQAESLTLCAYFNWSPWLYSTENGYDGVLIEQLSVFKQLNPEIRVDIVEIENWKRCQLEVANGHINMILGANKTPDREKIFDYLPTPSFINRVSVSAYSTRNYIRPVSDLSELNKYSVSFARGDSFGEPLDTFIHDLPKDKRFITNSILQSIKMVMLQRVDYFLLLDSSFDSTIRTYNRKNKPIEKSDLEKVYTHERAVPVYVVFGKSTGNYAKYADKWMAAIKEYNNNNNIEQRARFHIRNSGNRLR